MFHVSPHVAVDLREVIETSNHEMALQENFFVSLKSKILTKTIGGIIVNGRNF